MKALVLLLIALLCFTTFHCNCTPKLKVGDKAPDFELVDQDGNLVHLENLRGKKVALYFYPKDNTPGCTKQACSLRDRFDDLKKADILIFGVSKGSEKSKKKFIKEQHLNFPLLIATENILKAYGVNGGFFTFYLPKRRTFLIDENGIIVAIIKDVNVKNHAQQILDAFRSIQ